MQWCEWRHCDNNLNIRPCSQATDYADAGALARVCVVHVCQLSHEHSRIHVIEVATDRSSVYPIRHRVQRDVCKKGTTLVNDGLSTNTQEV